MSFPKTAWDRGTVQGGQQALVDLTLLSACPVLVGTFYSSYSEAARLLGSALFIQVCGAAPPTFDQSPASPAPWLHAAGRRSHPGRPGKHPSRLRWVSPCSPVSLLGLGAC